MGSFTHIRGKESHIAIGYLKMTRREAREELMNLLFESDFRCDEEAAEIFATSTENREVADDEYIRRAFFAINEKKEEIDAVITEHSHGWRSDRLGHVSRAVLRIGVYELMFEADIPSTVSINEAVEIIKKYDDEKARPFVNGVLNSVKNSLENK